MKQDSQTLQIATESPNDGAKEGSNKTGAKCPWTQQRKIFFALGAEEISTAGLSKK